MLWVKIAKQDALEAMAVPEQALPERLQLVLNQATDVSRPPVSSA